MSAGQVNSREPWSSTSVKGWLILLSILNLLSVSWGLRLIKVTVPTYRLRGEIARMECVYDMEGENLYSVKWYKDNEEFYRYVPRATPPQHSFKVEGIRVDHHLSDRVQLFLRSVTLKSSGVYRCEVSAEAPSFSSVSGEGRMEVVFPPKEPPRITGGKFGYEWNDWVDLNCTAGKSYPAATIRWFVSDRPVEREWMVARESLVYSPHGLISSVQGLRFRARPEQFLEPGPGGGGPAHRSGASVGGGESGAATVDARTLRLRCVATISALFREGGGEGRSPAGEATREKAAGMTEARAGDGPDASPALSPVIDSRESTFLVHASSSAAPPGIPVLALLLLSILITLPPSLLRRR